MTVTTMQRQHKHNELMVGASYVAAAAVRALANRGLTVRSLRIVDARTLIEIDHHHVQCKLLKGEAHLVRGGFMSPPRVLMRAEFQRCLVEWYESRH